MGLKADAIVGYTYDAEQLCPKCCVDSIVLDASKPPFKDLNAEQILDIVANTVYTSVDRQDERTFDSNEFPKVIFASQVEDDEQCYHCGENLI